MTPTIDLPPLIERLRALHRGGASPTRPVAQAVVGLGPLRLQPTWSALVRHFEELQATLRHHDEKEDLFFDVLALVSHHGLGAASLGPFVQAAKRLQAEHRQLLLKCDAIARVLAAVEGGTSLSTPEGAFAQAMDELVRSLRQHVLDEERILGPVVTALET